MLDQEIINFLEGTGVARDGLTLSQIWAFPDDEIERNHVFIQWMFPTDLLSASNKSGPVL